MQAYHMYMAARWPDLATLELLVAVADHCSIGAGARAVHMAQPNASRALTALERQLGVPVLVRHPRGATLTAPGMAVVEWARALLEQGRMFQRAVGAVATRHPVTLDIAASMTVAEHLLPRWLTTFDSDHVAVRLRVHNSADVMTGVRTADFALGFVETPELDPGLSAAVVARDHLRVVVAPDHPWARRSAPLTPQELASCPLIVRERGSGTRLTLEAALPHAAPPALEAGSNAAVLASAALGAAPAVISELAADSWVERGALVAVPVAGLSLERLIHAVWRGRLAQPARDGTGDLTHRRRTRAPDVSPVQLRSRRPGAVASTRRRVRAGVRRFLARARPAGAPCGTAALQCRRGSRWVSP